jgi:formate dehydrogenase major subunit
MVKEIVENTNRKFYLTTGRVINQYNNSTQSSKSAKLQDRYNEDIVYICEDDMKKIKSSKVILKSRYGETSALSIKPSDKLKPKTLFCTFHHASSKINTLFGDESDELIKTASFKSVEIEIIPVV